MDLGTGIVLGASILSGVQILIKFLPVKNNYKRAVDGLVSEKLCDTRFELLAEKVTKGLEGLSTDIQGLHQRIDKMFVK